MARRMFFYVSIGSLVLIGWLTWFSISFLYLLFLVIPFIILGLYDLTSTHNILRIYPVIGHFRYAFEFIRPEIQQYFVATNESGRPYNREIRSLVYQRAKNLEDTHPFGTERDIDAQGFQFIQHSIAVKKVPEEAGRIMVGGEQCKQPYNASRLNISAMSFGAISKNAVYALNLGAKKGNFAQNTGEGGLTPYHLKHGGDIVLQLGTAYFGYRTSDGKFDEKKFIKKSNLDNVKMIEIKISQGAKPSHGGLLPAAKISEEIAEIRGIERGKDCLSPPDHSEFSTPIELLQFVQRLRDMSNGKPVGFKLCIGVRTNFMGICKAMLETGIYPDFITVDGAEGGTGAAPLEYTNRFGAPLNEGLSFVHNCLVGTNLRDKMRIISSGKIATGFDMVAKFSIGADMCNAARSMMFAIGCIQAIRCNTNTCPTGVTTQDPDRMKAIIPEHKAIHVKNYHHATMSSFLDITGAMGINHPDLIAPNMVYSRVSEGESVTFADIFHFIEPGDFLSGNIHPAYKEDWENSNAQHF